MVGGGHVSPPWAHPRGSESRRGDGPRASRRSAGAGRGLPWVNGPHGDVGPFLLPEGKPRPTKATVSSGISEPIVEWSFVVTRPRPRPEGLPRRVHGQSLPTQLTYTSDASYLYTAVILKLLAPSTTRRAHETTLWLGLPRRAAEGVSSRENGHF